MKVEAKTTALTKIVKVSYKGSTKKDKVKVWKAPVNYGITSVKDNEIKEEHGAEVRYVIHRKEAQPDVGALTKIKKASKDKKNVDTLEITYQGKDKKSKASGHLTVTIDPQPKGGVITTPSRTAADHGATSGTPDTAASASPDSRTANFNSKKGAKTSTVKPGSSIPPFNPKTQRKQKLPHPSIPEEGEEDSSFTAVDDLAPVDEHEKLDHVPPQTDRSKPLKDSRARVKKTMEENELSSKPFIRGIIIMTLMYCLAAYWVIVNNNGELMFDVPIPEPIEELINSDEAKSIVNVWGQFWNAITIEWLGSSQGRATNA